MRQGFDSRLEKLHGSSGKLSKGSVEAEGLWKWLAAVVGVRVARAGGVELAEAKSGVWPWWPVFGWLGREAEGMLTVGRNLDRTGQPLPTYLCYSNSFLNFSQSFLIYFRFNLIILTFSF
jgi:hypothetical protein